MLVKAQAVGHTDLGCLSLLGDTHTHTQIPIFDSTCIGMSLHAHTLNSQLFPSYTGHMFDVAVPQGGI